MLQRQNKARRLAKAELLRSPVQETGSDSSLQCAAADAPPAGAQQPIAGPRPATPAKSPAAMTRSVKRKGPALVQEMELLASNAAAGDHPYLLARPSLGAEGEPVGSCHRILQ